MSASFYAVFTCTAMSRKDQHSAWICRVPHAIGTGARFLSRSELRQPALSFASHPSEGRQLPVSEDRQPHSAAQLHVPAAVEAPQPQRHSLPAAELSRPNSVIHDHLVRLVIPLTCMHCGRAYLAKPASEAGALETCWCSAEACWVAQYCFHVARDMTGSMICGMKTFLLLLHLEAQYARRRRAVLAGGDHASAKKAQIEPHGTSWGVRQAGSPAEIADWRADAILCLHGTAAARG